MTTLYPWFVFVHLVGLLVFVGAHGFSMVMSFRIRSERTVDTVVADLATSQTATKVATGGFLLLAIGGIAAATTADWWSKPWVDWSVIVLVVVIGAMYGVGARYYYRLRDRLAGKDGVAPEPITEDELAKLLDTRTPDILAGIGGLGLLVIVWLMVLKPG
jgi:Predicted integral membrane protein (DUF2269)